MATVTVDQQRLVLNAFAAIFQNNLVSKDLVTWRKFNDMEMNAIQMILDGSKALDEMDIKRADLAEKNEIARNKPSTPAGKNTSSPAGSKSQ